MALKRSIMMCWIFSLFFFLILCNLTLQDRHLKIPIFHTNELPYVINICSSRKELAEYSCCLFSPDLHPSILNTTDLTIFLYFPCRKPQKNNKLSLVYKWKDWKAHDSLNLTVIIQQLPVRVIMHMGNDILRVEHFIHVHNFEVMDYEMCFSLVFRLL